MTYQLMKKFQRTDRCIKILTIVLVLISILWISKVLMMVYKNQYEELWAMLPTVITIISALLFVQVANRLIVNGDITQENDRRQEIVRTTHHLIAITTDLLSRVEFCKAVLKKGHYRVIALTEIARTIEDRYETLLEREAYKYLSGNSVEIIIRISGSIFGIRLMAETINQATEGNSNLKLMNIPYKGFENSPNQLDDLMVDLQKLIDELYKVRKSLELEEKS